MSFEVHTFRVYPTPQQLDKLARWQGTSRFLWNLALEQRLVGLARPRGERHYPSHADQCEDLTLLRDEHDWIAEMPREVQGALLRQLDQATRDWFEGRHGKPRFKRKSGPGLSLTSPDKKAWRLVQRSGRDFLTFPKLGNLPIVLHRPVRGEKKVCRLISEADGWYAQLTCEVADVEHPPIDLDDPTGIGLDRGVTHLLAAPDGTLTPNPRFGHKAQARTAVLQRRLARKDKGSKNRAKARHQLALHHLKVRRQRDHHLTVLAHRIAKNHRVVVIEDLKLTNLTASAKGTVEAPGTNVAQKAGLNRSLLDAGLGLFALKLEHQMRKRGHLLVKVPAAYSSQTCGECRHVAAESRVGERFCCVACGHQAHADVNASGEIYSRRTAGEAVCGGTPAAGPMKQKPEAREGSDTKVERGGQKHRRSRR